MLSLETSRKLWEAGVRIETREHWWLSSDNKWHEGIGRGVDDGIKSLPAPSTDDLLGVLPKRIQYFNKDKGATLFISYNEYAKNDWSYSVYYAKQVGHIAVTELTQEKSLSEALASMVLYLISQGYHYEKDKHCLVR